MATGNAGEVHSKYAAPGDMLYVISQCVDCVRHMLVKVDCSEPA